MKLAAQLFDRSAMIEQDLREAGEGLRRLLRRAEEGRSEDTEALAAIDPKRMGRGQRTLVRAEAFFLSQLLAQRPGGPERSLALRDASALRRAVAKALTRGPVLTEDAWDALLAEDDPEVLAWCCALAVVPHEELHLSQLRRALLENPRLRAWALAAARDPKQMAEVAGLL